MEAQVEELAKPEEVRADARPLHVVYRIFYPVAVCGVTVNEPWENVNLNRPGRDRCTDCLMMDARGLGYGGSAADAAIEKRLGSLKRIIDSLTDGG